MSSAGATYAVTSGSGTATASTDPPGILFHAPSGITAPETDTITMTDGSFTTTITVPVAPPSGGNWDTSRDGTIYEPTVTPAGTVTFTDPSHSIDAAQEAFAPGTEYQGWGAGGQDAAAILSGGSVAYEFFWVPDFPSAMPPAKTCFSVTSDVVATDYYFASDGPSGGASVSDGLGDAQTSGSVLLGNGVTEADAGSSGTRILPEDTHSGTASFSTRNISASATGPYSASVITRDWATPLTTPDVSVSLPSDGAILAAGGDVVVTVTAPAEFLSDNAATAVQSVALKVEGGSGGGAMTEDPNNPGRFTLDIGSQMAGVLTLTAQAQYGDGGGGMVEVDSPPSTFIVATFSVKTNSWSPNPAAVSQVITGQAMASFDPSAVTGSPYFVIYNWTTAGVWYSPSGTAGTFEPCGSYAIGWSQGQATTTFSAQFFTPGQYLLEVQCVASVYSQYNGSLIASFTQTAYIGGDASDIDTSGAGAAQTDGAGGAGVHIIIVPVTVTFSPNSLIKLGLGAPAGYWKTVTATVSPAIEVKNFEFTASNGEVSVSCNPSDISLRTGVATLTITAASETPPSTKGASDCNVEAIYNDGITLPTETVPVLVLKPTSSVETPANSNEKSVTNLCIPAGDKVPKGWNIAPPPPKSTTVYFATQCLLPITITILDQFGSKLDPMYNGYHVVNETITGNSTVNNQPIDNPDGNFANGQIVDDVTLTAEQPDDPSDNQFDYLVEHWPGFNALFNGTSSAGGGVWDNAIALTYSNTTLLDHQMTCPHVEGH